MSGPKVLLLDIETAPILGYVWGLWDQTVALNQIHSDSFILGWAAKWLGDKKIIYHDQRNAPKIEDEKAILKILWKLLNEADILITHNGRKFDIKRINARLAFHGFPPPSSVKHIDTLVLAKKHFAFTSNKLEYLTDRLCKKHKKSTHAEFPGFTLWTQCLLGNKRAWKAMERYNKQDVLSLEELYYKLQPWDTTVSFAPYYAAAEWVCNCGSTERKQDGHRYTKTGKFQRYQCKKCGSESRGAIQLHTKAKRDNLAS